MLAITLMFPRGSAVALFMAFSPPLTPTSYRFLQVLSLHFGSCLTVGPATMEVFYRPIMDPLTGDFGLPKEQGSPGELYSMRGRE